MKHKAPPVREFMTRLPVECDQCSLVGEAAELMDKHQIRHLPVIKGTRLIGIVSQSDVTKAHDRHGDASATMPLTEICASSVLAVSPMDPLSSVAQQMLEQHVRSAVVVDGGYVVGMFTTTDALNAIATLFH